MKILLNPFERKSFKYNSQVIVELSAVEFLAAIKAIAEGDSEKFFAALNLPVEERREITSSEKSFKGFLNDFLSIHKEEISGSGESKKEQGDIETLYKSCIQIVKVFAEVFHIDPASAGKVYSLRQMILWLQNEETTKKASGGIRNSDVPADARNYREWTDGAGNKCRRWETVIRRR
ncbi:MAG: hypothetical protein BWY64_02731 [bacterium ADurb.Bin363]|nr:MAG: hypothetical protein BWY64_02731 [bacterium ADurb.Bin363]